MNCILKLNQVNHLSELKKYINDEHLKNLHEGAFLETFNKLIEYVNQGFAVNNQANDVELLSWVCNSAPGSGKTTALQVVTKMLLEESNYNDQVSLLLVFNNNDTMRNDFYNGVFEFVKKNHIKDGIQYVDEKVKELVVDSLSKYKVVCINQQRLRDLKIGFGKRSDYIYYSPEILKNDSSERDIMKPKKRIMIIDEMPIFYDSQIWDITSKNNSFDWFEKLVEQCKEISEEECFEGRKILSKLVNEELANNTERNSNLKLIRLIEGSNDEMKFNAILEKLSNAKNDFESSKRFRWFLNLYNNDDVAAIDRTNNKPVILCSEWLDYRELELNILILDGTALITKMFYDFGHFEFHKVHNYHNYQDRLMLEWKDINTKKSLRDKKTKADEINVKEIISSDFLQMRENITVSKSNINMIILPPQTDIRYYYDQGVITTEQYREHFKGREKSTDDMASHLHNITGKNGFSKYDALALLNIPIKSPQLHREIGVAMHGVNLDLTLNKTRNNGGSWFNEASLQEIFMAVTLSDISQIIHRCSLRFIASNSKVYVFLYCNREEWIISLKELFGLPDRNIRMHPIYQEIMFRKKCEEKVKLIYEKMIGKQNLRITADRLGINNLKQWLNDYKQYYHIVTEECSKYNIVIEEDKKPSGKIFRFFKLIGD